jgi:hypothetical protein
MATLLDQYKEWPSWTSGENLRADLIKIVQKHIDKLMLSS